MRSNIVLVMLASHTVQHPAELLAFLFACCPDVKRTTVRQWLKHQAVQVNGRPITRTNHALQTGDVVAIHPKGDVRGGRRLPPGMSVVWEDASLIVIEKPHHLLSMANASERDKTAYSYLTRYVRGGDRRRTERVWIVHRLDREVSGLMVFARRRRRPSALCKQLGARLKNGTWLSWKGLRPRSKG